MWVPVCVSEFHFTVIMRGGWKLTHLLYLPSERSETGGYTVFTFVRLCVCLCALSPVFNNHSPLANICTL